MTCLMIFLGFYQENNPILSGLVGFEVNDFLVSYLGRTGLMSILVFTIIFILVVQWGLTPEKLVHFFKFLFKQEKPSKEVPIENSLDMEIDTFVSESKEITDEPISEIDPTPEIYPPERKEELEMEVEHVMEEESFEDQETADFLNKNFVSIKVDREERPDVDSVYMTSVQIIAGHGGWPMSSFLTPEGRPFFAGTYFPKEGRHGIPSFIEVLKKITLLYLKNKR